MAGSKFQARINRKGLRRIAGLQETARRVWAKACAHEGIEPGSSFVSFADDNPYVPFVDRVRAELVEAVQAYRDGGYVGLTL